MTRMAILLIGACLMLASLPLASMAQEDELRDAPETETAPDSAFVSTAIRARSAEKQLGVIAERKAKSRSVRDFARELSVDDETIDDRLNRLASGLGIIVSSELDDRHRALHLLLSDLDGISFDRAYVSAQLHDLEVTTRLFETEVELGSDLETRQFAERALGTLHRHLRTARALAIKPSG